jgi:hypothetical protein
LRISWRVWGSIIKLPFGTLAKSVTAHTTPLVVSGDCADGSGVSYPPVGEGVTESERNDCVLYLQKINKCELNFYLNMMSIYLYPLLEGESLHVVLADESCL